MSGGNLKREDWRQHLRDLATAATGGPWSWHDDELVGTPDTGEFILHRTSWGFVKTPSNEDAAWIAAASPSVVVALLDRVDELETRLEDAHLSRIEAQNPGIDIDQVRAQRKASADQ